MSGFLIGALLVICVALFVGYRIKHIEFEDLKQCHANDFIQFNITKEQLLASRKEIDELKAELSERPLPVQPEESEIGNFVKRRAMKHATPKIYRNVFDLDPNGRSVIDHLELRFANKSTYVRGGQDAERESCFRAGQANVISFIINQINNADNPNYKEEVNDSASK